MIVSEFPRVADWGFDAVISVSLPLKETKRYTRGHLYVKRTKLPPYSRYTYNYSVEDPRRWGTLLFPNAEILGLYKVEPNGLYALVDHNYPSDRTVIDGRFLMEAMEATGKFEANYLGSLEDLEPGIDPEGWVFNLISRATAVFPGKGIIYEHVVDFGKWACLGMDEVEEIVNTLIDKGLVHEPILGRILAI